MPFLDNPLIVMLLQNLWGIAVKYFPALKDFPNRAIHLCNLLIAVLAKLLAPEPAHASFFGDLSRSLGWFLVPLQTMGARLIYETFIRPTLEQFGVLGNQTVPVKGEQPKVKK